MSPIQLNFYSISHDNLETPILKIDAENITDKVIKEYIVRIFAYDSDGIPCKVNFDDFTTLLRDTTPIKPGAHSRSEGYWQLYGEYDEDVYKRQIQAWAVALSTFESSPNIQDSHVRLLPVSRNICVWHI